MKNELFIYWSCQQQSPFSLGLVFEKSSLGEFFSESEMPGSRAPIRTSEKVQDLSAVDHRLDAADADTSLTWAKRTVAKKEPKAA
jgi:hypothetical protein